jgi:two-component sensor histidine kinase
MPVPDDRNPVRSGSLTQDSLVTLNHSPAPPQPKQCPFRSAAIRYVCAVLVVVVATILRQLLHPALKDSAPFALYFLGAILTAWYLGLGPALVTIVAGAFAGNYFFLHPLYSFRIQNSADRHTMSAFIAIAIIVAIVSSAQRTARMRAESARRVAEEESARRRIAEETLRRQQAEIEVLNARLQRALAETHHRVKNNLQVITAMVELQVADSDEMVSADALRRIGHHVQALATVHDILTGQVKEEGSVELLDTRAVLNQLRPLLEGLIGDRRLRFTVDDLPLPIRQGTHLAVLINELVSNAVKHGEGDIELTLAVVNEQGQLQVRDRGPGFPPDFDPRTAGHTGLELIQSLSRWDLGGDLSFLNHPEGGAQITVTFPVR